MTAFYRCNADAASIARLFGAEAGADPWAGGAVSPGCFAPVVTAGREFVAGSRPSSRSSSEAIAQTRITPRLWGVPPPPSVPDARPVLSVRNPDSPFWIGNLRNSEFRCLVPATAFLLWGSGTDYEGRRLKHWFGLPDGAPFAMAGVWKDSEVPSFAILTRPAAGTPKDRRAERMPVVMEVGSRAASDWLHAGWDRAKIVLESEELLLSERGA